MLLMIIHISVLLQLTVNIVSDWEKEVDSKFSTLISTSRDNIPWLSSDSPSGSLVKHYVMVQDIMDQEFYTKQFVARLE